MIVNTRFCIVLLIILAFFASVFYPPSVNAVTKEVNQNTGVVQYLNAADGLPQIVSNAAGQTPEDIARAYLDANGSQFGIRNEKEELQHVKTIGHTDTSRSIQFKFFTISPTPVSATDDLQHVVFQQKYQQIPVFGSEMALHLKNNQLLTVYSSFEPNVSIKTTPALSEQDAMNAVKQIWQSKGITVGQAKNLGLVIVPASFFLENTQATTSLCYQIELSDTAIGPTEHEYLFIDAQTGKLLLTLPGIYDAERRTTRDCLNQYSSPSSSCPVKRVDSQGPSGQADVDAFHDSVDTIYQHFFSHYKRDSFDGNGSVLNGYARLRCARPNAYWNGRTLNFCTGVVSKDIVGHEYTHAFTQYTANLVYSYQSGALNEAVSDIFGSMTDNNWTMGEGSALGIIRDMTDPPKHNQPDKLYSKLYSVSSADNGGVHRNSGIANKAAFLIADGGSFNGCTVRGIGRDKMGLVLYTAMTKGYILSKTNYAGFYKGMNDACVTLASQGLTKDDCMQVDNALKAVEANQESLTARTPDRTESKPDCSSTSLPDSTPGVPTSTSIPGAPSITPVSGLPTTTPGTVVIPTTKPGDRSGEMAIWITTMSGGSEIEVGDGSKLPKGTPISILYNRKSGPFSLTIDRGEGSKSTFTAVFSEARKGGYLRTAMNERFLPLGNLASPDGSRHIYTACSGDECVSTSILVTTATSSIKQMSKFLWLPWNQ